MLSTMTQIGAAACLAMLIWVMYGYSLSGRTCRGRVQLHLRLGKAFLKGVTPASQAATFTAGVEIPNMSSSASR
jgi:Amt family ammonium transporter